jgi:hypothetical protein
MEAMLQYLPGLEPAISGAPTAHPHKKEYDYKYNNVDSIKHVVYYSQGG